MSTLPMSRFGKALSLTHGLADHVDRVPRAERVNPRRHAGDGVFARVAQPLGKG